MAEARHGRNRGSAVARPLFGIRKADADVPMPGISIDARQDREAMTALMRTLRSARRTDATRLDDLRNSRYGPQAGKP